MFLGIYNSYVECMHMLTLPIDSFIKILAFLLKPSSLSENFSGMFPGGCIYY